MFVKRPETVAVDSNKTSKTATGAFTQFAFSAPIKRGREGVFCVFFEKNADLTPLTVSMHNHLRIGGNFCTRELMRARILPQ